MAVVLRIQSSRKASRIGIASKDVENDASSGRNRKSCIGGQDLCLLKKEAS